MPLFEIILTLTSLALLILLCFFGGRKTWQIRCFQLGLVILGLHLIFETARWQMIFCYLTFTVASLLVLKNSVSHLLFRITGFFIGLLLICTSAFYSVFMPIKDLPIPSGPYKVGTTNFALVDQSREELLTDDPKDKRALFAEVWYPANVTLSQEAQVSSLWPELYRGKMDRVSFFMNYLKKVKSSSYPEAAPDLEHGPFPLILFNHGLQLFSSQSTILMEHLASHGYVLVSIGHPYESLRVNLPGVGTVMPEFIMSLKKFREAMEWINKTSAPILAARDSMKMTDSPRERADIMLRAVEGSEMNDLVSVWVADNRFVLDQLITSTAVGHDFTVLIDTSRIGAMGMSVGGATAAELSKADRRIRAAINIDGQQYGQRNHIGLKVPFMMLYSKDVAGVNEFLRLDSKNDFLQYTFKNARHADFTDMPYIWPVMRIYGQLGTIPAEKMIEISNSLILNFWDHYLKAQPLKDFEQNYSRELEYTRNF